MPAQEIKQREIAPYAVAFFGELYDGKLFIIAEQGHDQDELSLGLPWNEIYRRVVKEDEDGFRQMVKVDGEWGLNYSGIVYSRLEADTPVITGPLLSDEPKIGGEISSDELKLLRHLYDMQFCRERWNELKRIIGIRFAWQLSSTVKHLTRAKLVRSDDDSVTLTNLGVLRVLQEQT